MPVLYDATGALSQHGLNNRHVHLVMEPGMTINHRAAFTDSTWQPAVDALLSP